MTLGETLGAGKGAIGQQEGCGEASDGTKKDMGGGGDSGILNSRLMTVYYFRYTENRTEKSQAQASVEIKM
jgi:hypothetical protein